MGKVCSAVRFQVIRTPFVGHWNQVFKLIILMVAILSIQDDYYGGVSIWTMMLMVLSRQNLLHLKVLGRLYLLSFAVILLETVKDISVSSVTISKGASTGAMTTMVSS